jgi:hypothetical protein
VSATSQLSDAPESDLIDRIADALPADVRADYYRELRHCRSLPENDEMLRILRAMQFLALLIHEAPARMAAECVRLDGNLGGCIGALETIERRLEMLPEGIESAIGPERVAARINESLRQEFVRTTIPETGQALASAAVQMKGSIAQFVVAAREISNQHHSTAKEAREAVKNIEAAIHSATRASREATAELLRALIHLKWTSLVAGALGLYLLGLMTGFLLFR